MTDQTQTTTEPVAWRYRYPRDDAWQITQDHDQAFKNTGEVEPLGVIPFTTPQPLAISLDREAVATIRAALDSKAGIVDLRDFSEELMTLLALSAPAEGWRGIETAPDDGENVDVWLAPLDDEGNALTPCRQPNAWFECGGWWCWPSGLVGPVRINHRITHWMPLPAAPTGETGA